MGVASCAFANLLFLPSITKIYTIDCLRVSGVCNKTLLACNAAKRVAPASSQGNDKVYSQLTETVGFVLPVQGMAVWVSRKWEKKPSKP